MLRKIFRKRCQPDYQEIDGGREKGSLEALLDEKQDSPFLDVPLHTEADDVDAAQRRVRLCPHETCSYDRLCTILAIRDIKRRGACVGSLTGCSDNVHNSTRLAQSHPDGSKVQCDLAGASRWACEPDQDGYRAIRGWGSYYCKNGELGPLAVLSLNMNWEIYFGFCPPHVRESVQTISSWLRKFNIRLCPHTLLGSEAFSSRLMAVLNPESFRDPVELKEIETGKSRCYHCESAFYVTKRDKLLFVKAIRRLGSEVSMKKILGKRKSGWEKQCE